LLPSPVPSVEYGVAGKIANLYGMGSPGLIDARRLTSH